MPRRWAGLVAKVRRLNPDWSYRLWTDADNDAFVAREFPDLLERFRAYPRPIMRADVIRYLLLARIGGVYLDLDYEVLAPFDFGPHALVLPLNRSRAQGDGDDGIGNCILASAPGHPFWDAVVEALRTDRTVVRTQQDVIDATGPGLLTRVHRGGRFDDAHLPDRPVWHPPSPRSPRDVEVLAANGVTRGVHHTWGSWRGLTARLRRDLVRSPLTQRLLRRPGSGEGSAG